MSTVGLHVDRELDLTVMTLTGVLEIEQIRHLIRQPEFGTTTRSLWDCRDVSFANITRDDLAMVAAEQVALLQQQVTTRTAVVVAEGENGPFSRMYFEMARLRFGRDTASFVTTDMEAARKWLYRAASDDDLDAAAE